MKSANLSREGELLPQNANVTAPPISLRKIYQQFLRSMLKKGHVRHKGETALEHIEKIAATRSDQEYPDAGVDPLLYE